MHGHRNIKLLKTSTYRHHQDELTCVNLVLSQLYSITDKKYELSDIYNIHVTIIVN